METLTQQINVNPKGEEIKVINESYAQRRVHDWNPLALRTDSAHSFVKAVNNRLTDKTVVAINYSGVVANLDTDIQNRPIDKIGYSYELSDEAKDWKQILDSTLPQKKIIDFIKCRPSDELENRDELISLFSNLRFITAVNVEQSISDNVGNKTVVFKSESGEGTAKVPSEIIINMKMLNEGIMDTQKLIIELDVVVPKNEGDKIGIKMSCIRWDRYYKEAIKADMKFIVEILDNKCLVVLGGIN